MDFLMATKRHRAWTASPKGARQSTMRESLAKKASRRDSAAWAMRRQADRSPKVSRVGRAASRASRLASGSGPAAGAVEGESVGGTMEERLVMGAPWNISKF